MFFFCFLQRFATADDRRPKFGSPIQPKTGNENHGARVAVGILTPLFLVLLAMTAYYVIRKRRSGKFNVRFVNAIIFIEGDLPK